MYKNVLKLCLSLVVVFALLTVYVNCYAEGIAQYSDNIIPAMKGNNSPSPFVITSNDVYNNLFPYRAFDRDDISYWYVFPGSSSNWLKVKLDKPRKVEKIVLTSFNISSGGNTGSIKNWKLYGSNNDSEYALITEGIHPNTSSKGMKSYEFSNKDSYLYYKLEILDGYQPTYPHATGVLEMEMMERIDYPPTLTINSTTDKAKIGDEITTDIVIHNATNICAEDIRITYDTNLLEYIGAVAADGMKIYKEADLTNGSHRYITASLGKDNVANGDKVLFKLKFKAKVAGQAKMDIVKGRIADNATLETDVNTENCGEKIITIEGTKDVNKTGDYTLLDLGIDAWYYGYEVSATGTTKYDADQNGDSKIDDNDLTIIVNQLLNNANYPVN